MPDAKNRLTLLVALLVIGVGCASLRLMKSDKKDTPPPQRVLTIKQDEQAGTISVFRTGKPEPVLTQHAKPDTRPYVHPIAAPDGKGVLTEYSPEHHVHQTGLYWGFTRVNGRDYFHNPQGDYWRRASAGVIEGKDDEVRWQTVYELLDASGNPVLVDTQRWSMRERNGRFIARP